MPYRFLPIASGTPQDTLISVINGNFAQLDSEAVTKSFSGPNGNPALINGKLSHGFYGTVLIDQSNRVRKLTGFDSTGTFIDLTVKDGSDAYTSLGY